MKFTLSVVLLIAGAGAAGAQPAAGGKKAAAPFTLPEGAEPIRLTIQGAPAGVPALRYRLLPEVRDLKPGNAVVLYYRAFSPEWHISRPEYSKVINAWSEKRREVPPKELHWVLKAPALKEMDLGARRAYVDWEMNDRMRQEGIYMLLPDIQSFRSFATLLAARSRLEGLAGDYDKAIFTQQTGLKLGRDIAHAPTLIQALVGVAVVTMMLEQMEEMIGSPGSPNLYWALTDLPRPFINLQTPFQGERLFIDNMFPGMRELLAEKHARPLPDEQVRAWVGKAIKSLSEMGVGESASDWEVRLAIAGMTARSYPEARRFLLAQGRSKQDVDSLSVLQAFVLLEVHNFDRYYDESIKWSTLPYWESRKGILEGEVAIKKAKASSTPGTLLATLVLPAIVRVQEASARVDRRIAALRVIEALRLYAAGHDGTLPASLQGINEVPLPLDPFTNHVFQYRVEKDRAVLFAPAPPGETPTIYNTLMYELKWKRS